MKEDSSRRQFIQAAAGAAIGAWLPGGAFSGDAAEIKAGSPGAGLNREAVEAEIRRRASWHVEQTRLVVDYYRIGRKLAYPLPVTRLSVPDVPVPGIPGYPWATWMTWTLEERVLSLGWAAEWFGDERARSAASADLAALAQWPRYGETAAANLSAPHTGRVLWTAAVRWRWVGDDLRRKLCEACRRHVEGCRAAVDKLFGAVQTKDDVLRRPAPHGLLHNIGLIFTAGAALTAAAAQQPASSEFNRRLLALFGAVLDLRTVGFSEGVAYDGYVLDFLADWLGTLPENQRAPILKHPNLDHYLEQSYMLSAPGAAGQVAEIGDVEPREMPFHLSAQAKLLALRGSATGAWHLARCPTDWFRSDGLAAMRLAKGGLLGRTPPAGALDAHYAAVLRTGWESDDLAVAVSCTNSPMGHLPADNGTLVLGTRGKWLIADPGYQQYAKGDEREFTVGPMAHNAPLIHGAAQTRKQARRVVLEEVAPDLRRVAVDLTGCYPSATPLTKLVRHVWLAGKKLVVVADQLEGREPLRATYHWHGHPACAWWFEAGWAMLALHGVRFWLTSPQSPLSGVNLHRLPGSRGQLSLVCPLEKAGPVVWWAFVLGGERPELPAVLDDRRIRILDQTFAV